MILMTDEEFQERLMNFGLQQLEQGLNIGINVACAAFQDALERAEFVGFGLLAARVTKTIQEAFDNTPFAVHRKREDEEEDDDGNP
jgi:hypothetical protein